MLIEIRGVLRYDSELLRLKVEGLSLCNFLLRIKSHTYIYLSQATAWPATPLIMMNMMSCINWLGSVDITGVQVLLIRVLSVVSRDDRSTHSYQWSKCWTFHFPALHVVTLPIECWLKSEGFWCMIRGYWGLKLKVYPFAFFHVESSHRHIFISARPLHDLPPLWYWWAWCLASID